MTKLPNKAYEAELYDSCSEISYYPKKIYSGNTNPVSIKLPAWLRDLINEKVNKAYQSGRSDAKWQIRQVLGIP